jgi:hypothetical protein
VAEAFAAFVARRDAIEEAYEFMLRYAAEGVPREQKGASSGRIREVLRQCDAALEELDDLVAECVLRREGVVKPQFEAFINTIARDSRDARAVVQVVLAQPAIGSQIIDNLNASIHIRALLTDLFLIDEVLKS